MLKDTIELAENKLLLLYIFGKIGTPVSHSHITQIVLENNLLNYFQLQQYLSELIEGKFIVDSKAENKHMMSMTPLGMSALEFFEVRIPDKKKDIIDNYFKKSLQSQKKIEALCDYKKTKDDKYIINLKLIESDNPLIEMNITVVTKEQCDMVCESWKQNPRKIYSKILNSLVN